MAKITRAPKKTFADIIRAKKKLQIEKAKEKELAIQKAKDLQFDTFVKNTAKDMLKGTSRCQLQVFNSNATTKISQTISDNSVWAPWSKMNRK